MNFAAEGASGFEAFNAMKKEDDARQASFGTFRFFLKKGASALIAFLSDAPDLTIYEHMLKINGRWENIRCPGEGCPICAAGGESARRSLVSLFSVIRITALPEVDKPRYPDKDRPDDRSWEADWRLLDPEARSQKTGRFILNPVNLLASKKQTTEVIAKYAGKYDNLRGLKFEVSRSTGDTAPSVGDTWIYDDKRYTTEELSILHPDFKPINVHEVVPLPDLDALRARFVGHSESAAVAGQSIPVVEPPARKLNW